MRDILQLIVELARMPDVSFINECCKDHCDLWVCGANVILTWTWTCFFNQSCITWIYIHITVDEGHYLYMH